VIDVSALLEDPRVDPGVVGLVLAVLPFALSSTLTPGPNTILVTASGATFGFRRTIPHMLGILFGFPVMMVAVGLGLGALFESHPAVHATLRWAGAAYLLFLAWKIATARASEASGARSSPLSFLQAAAFQWVNPKAWVMSISAVTTFTSVGGDTRRETLVIAAIFALVTLPAIPAWTLFGVAVSRLLRSERALRIFNATMAGLLVASLIPLFS
jgi:threonine/homoserine/homoserine lactone efflux protein